VTNDRVDVASDLHDRALELLAAARYSESEELCLQALALLREELGDGHPDVADVTQTLGRIMEAWGRLEEARDYYQCAVAMLPARGAERVQRIRTRTLSRLAGISQMLGFYDLAANLFTAALMTAERAFGSDDPDVRAILNQMEVMHRRRRQSAQNETEAEFAGIV
jgi:tetratricopeptide (TPR) repeat protein